jgi:quercetin 2,3-dioxygenase
MLSVRKSADRGHTDLGWLDSHHTFSFGGYHDPAHMGFRSLRVLNDDRVAAGQGFGAHGHRDMEILSYVLEGTLAHKDSMSDVQTLGTNEVQAMSAGSGVIHSEFNPSVTEPVHFLQIWIEPSESDLIPSYQRLSYQPEEKHGALRLLAAPVQAARASTIRLHQDAWMYAVVLEVGDAVTHAIGPHRHVWVHCASGGVDINGVALHHGDGLAVVDERELSLRGTVPGASELLLFDLA